MNIRIGIASVLMLLVASVSRSQTSFPFLFSLSPCGVQRGQSVLVTLNGLHNYHGAYRVWVQGDGVSGEIVPPKDGWPKRNTPTSPLPVVNEITFKLTASPTAAVGIRELRVGTPRGLSTIGQIVVSDEAEANEVEPNEDLARAQALTLPVTVNGKIGTGEDVDSYRFKAAAGEALTFTVLCARLQDKVHDLQAHADPLLSLRDSTGREIAANDDYFRADPLLHHKFEKAGDFTIQVRDVGYAGNSYWVYRLNITRRPYITSMLPLAVQRGSTASVRAEGFGVARPEPCKLDVGDRVLGAQLVQLETPGGTSNPVAVMVTDVPCRAVSSSPSAAKPEPLSPPCAVSAQIDPYGAAHRFKFSAKAGQSYVLDVFARRFDSRLDPVLVIMNDAGGEIARNDDSNGPDSHLDWTCPKDGDYLIDVRDLHQHGGANFVYALQVRQSGQDFSLRCDDDKMSLAPGTSAPWYVHVVRKFGFSGPVRVEVRGLPPGITASPLTIPSSMTQGCLVLSAAMDAKQDFSGVQVVGTADLPGADGKPISFARTAVPICEIYIPGGGRGLTEVQTQGVAIVPDVDIRVKVSTTAVTLAPGESARIDVEIVRSEGFKRPVTLDVMLRHLGSVYGNPLPPGVTLDENASKTLLGENETKGHIVLKAASDAIASTSVPIAVLGQVSINFVIKASYAAPAVLVSVAPKK